uniref:Schlafen AlbA-2 domain-containing protein n=1 Tax=Neobodo designis TaxID=312471 RepID=A0A7S1W6D0_NEODS
MASAEFAAQALCASANAAFSGNDAEATFSLPLRSGDRAGEDHARRLLDQALVMLYPQLDPRQLCIEVRGDALVTSVVPALQPLCGPRVTFRGEALVWECGAVVAASQGDMAHARKTFFKAHKDAIRRAREVLAGLYACNTERKPRKVLASGVGVRVALAVIAVDAMYAYVGIPFAVAHDSWRVVGRLPKALVTVDSSSFSHRRPSWVRSTAHCVKFLQGSLRWRSLTPRTADCVVVGHRVSFSSQDQGVVDDDTIEIDDMGIVVDDDSDLTTLPDVADSVGTAFGEALAAAQKNGPVATAVEALRVTGEDRYRRAPGSLRTLRKERDERCNAAAFSKGTVVPWREAATVEFKAKISLDLHDDSQTNPERVRQILSAMANTHGGVLFVGIGDDGTVLGAPKVKDSIRLTHFSPAMISDSVTLHEFPVAGSAESPMAADWWKQGAALPNSNDPVSVVTRIAVTRSVAPFHLCGATAAAAPMVRGAASSLPLSTGACVERLVLDECVQAESKRQRECE